jgi:hypothetical protein
LFEALPPDIHDEEPYPLELTDEFQQAMDECTNYLAKN